MGFKLGGLTEALDRDVKVGLALDANGVVQGVTSWMPVYSSDGVIAGWTLDLMRRADGGFRATMEFLIASSALHFKAQGAQFISLSGAPLAKSDTESGGESAVDKLLKTLGATLEPVYGFRSLHAFKSKFQPRLSPMYMVFRDEGDLPRIGIAITRAYLRHRRCRRHAHRRQTLIRRSPAADIRGSGSRAHRQEPVGRLATAHRFDRDRPSSAEAQRQDHHDVEDDQARMMVT